MPTAPVPLGDSPFNYFDYTDARFLHYYQQIHHVLALRPSSVLEIGPGDQTVSDFLRRKGFAVRTFDNDERLRPDYLGDLLRPLNIPDRFDLVLASEVFEHFRFQDLEMILDHVKRALVPRGHLVVSLPYTTIRLFPPRARWTGMMTCEGRVHTAIPYYVVQAGLTVVRGIYRVVRRGDPLRRAFAFYRAFNERPADVHVGHHWDLGTWPTTRSRVRRVLERHFDVLEERAYLRTNCVFFIMRARD